MTAGRDGCVFLTDVALGTHKKLYETDEPINCFAHDPITKSVWYGTNESSIQCFSMAKSEIVPDKGTPSIKL
jgi:hypothetical protein